MADPQSHMIPPAAARRPVDLSTLEEHVSLLKLKIEIARDDSRKKTVTVPKNLLCPTVQAEVGSNVSTDVFRYRLLVPIAQVTASTAGSFHRTAVASATDLAAIEQAFVRHFGGAACHIQDPSPVRGVGARDPSDVAGTSEQNEHVIFEVYAAPIHASDEYFRAVRCELEQALGEGVILIERQRVTLI